MAGDMFADEIDGVRMSWNVWPRSKVEASKCVIPLAASITPIRRDKDIRNLPYLPVSCEVCSSILNPYCCVDFRVKTWICTFCSNLNTFPGSYSAMSEQHRPAELYPETTTVEYNLQQQFQQNPNDSGTGSASPPVFLFVLDTCLIETELELAKLALRREIALLPQHAVVGFISFGAQVKVHDLGSAHMPESHLFGGTKEISKEDIVVELGLSLSAQRRPAPLGQQSQLFSMSVWIRVVTRTCCLCLNVKTPLIRGNLEIRCSEGIKIQGIIGPCTSLEKQGKAVSDKVIGQGNTTLWKFCGLDKTTCFTVFFDVSPADQSNPRGTANPQLYLQFLTSYQNPEGQLRLRVITVTRKWVETDVSKAVRCQNFQDLMEGFDQEAAAVIMARLTSLKMDMEKKFDATGWIDGFLIRLCSRFGNYRKDDPTSFTLDPSFSIFPQLMFNLRRSQFLQVFNSSPDETAYFRMLLNRECINNALLMIQPSLVSFSLDSNAAPAPVLLDMSSVKAFRILLLDAYFSVVVYHGSTLAQFRDRGYQNCPAHKKFSQILQASQEEARRIVQERYPVPRLVDCDELNPQKRFLLARLNPSATDNSAHVPFGSDVITDDISQQVFFEHLQRMAVKSSDAT
ncbi:hypothetical protein MKX03_008185 [Papaver bracteatum]|nr:hypothetical protein MKX03_008185 [Papaver bracteatum]